MTKKNNEPPVNGIVHADFSDLRALVTRKKSWRNPDYYREIGNCFVISNFTSTNR